MKPLKRSAMSKVGMSNVLMALVILTHPKSSVWGQGGELRKGFRCVGSCSPEYADAELTCERICSCSPADSACNSDTCDTSTVYCVLSDRDRWQSRVVNLQGMPPYKIMVAFSVVDENCNPPTIDEPLRAMQFFEDGVESSDVESFQGFVTKSLQFKLRFLLLVDQSKSIQDAQAIPVLRSSIRSFVDTMLDIRGFAEVQMLIAGFDGLAALTHHTGDAFLSDKEALDAHVQSADLGYSDPSTNLYGAWTSALERLEREDAADPDAISVLVVFSDGADQAGFSSLSAVQAKAAASDGPMLYAVTLEGEQGVEFEQFIAAAGRNGIFRVSNLQEMRSGFLELGFVLSKRLSNLYVYLYCTPKRHGTHQYNFEFFGKQIQTDDVLVDISTISVVRTGAERCNSEEEYDAAVCCNEITASRCDGCDAFLDLATDEVKANLLDTLLCRTSDFIPDSRGDECGKEIDDCDVNADCTNTVGSFFCQCKRGYAGNGTNGGCASINECSASGHNCDSRATCIETAASFQCACNSGFTGVGTDNTCGADGSMRNRFGCLGSCSPEYADAELTCERICSCSPADSACNKDTCDTSTVYCVLSDRDRWQSRVVNLQGMPPYKIMVAFSVVDENCNPPTIDEPLRAMQFFEDGVESSDVESFQGFVTKSLQFKLRFLLLVDQSKSIQDAQAIPVLRSSIQSFVDTMLDIRGFAEVQMLIAGFDGLAALTHHTGDAFLSDKEALDAHVQSADLGYSDPSTNLYGAWTSALERLEREDAADPDAISVLVVFSDGADQAGFSSLSAVQAKAAASDGPMLYAVTLEGEQGVEFEQFIAAAGRNGIFRVSNLQEMRSGFSQLFFMLSKRLSNLYVYLYCTPKRHGTHQYNFEFFGKSVLDQDVAVDVSATGVSRDRTLDCQLEEEYTAAVCCNEITAAQCDGCNALLNISIQAVRDDLRDVLLCGSAPLVQPDPNPDAGAAPDIDECSSGLHDCAAQEQCLNTADGFSCVCGEGCRGVSADSNSTGAGSGSACNAACIAGIVVGVAIFLALLVFCAWFVRRKRAEKGSKTAEEETPLDGQQGDEEAAIDDKSGEHADTEAQPNVGEQAGPAEVPEEAEEGLLQDASTADLELSQQQPAGIPGIEIVMDSGEDTLLNQKEGLTTGVPLTGSGQASARLSVNGEGAREEQQARTAEQALADSSTSGTLSSSAGVAGESSQVLATPQAKRSGAVSEAPSASPLSPLCIRVQNHAEGSRAPLLFNVDLLAADMRQGVEIKDRQSSLHVEPSTFLGQDALAWLQDHARKALVDEEVEGDGGQERVSRPVALILAQRLLDMGVFRQVAGTQEGPLEDANALFRFHEDEKDPPLLNCSAVRFESAREASLVVSELLQTLLSLRLKLKPADLRGSEELTAFAAASAELQLVNLSELTRVELLSFFINAYNLLALHAHIARGWVEGSHFKAQKASFTHDNRYRIAAYNYCLAEMEEKLFCRVLRAKFPSGSEESRAPEPRVHFALALGCVSSPALRIFHPNTLDAELDQAASDYINAPSHRPSVSPVSANRRAQRSAGTPGPSSVREVVLPRVFKWFKDDFGFSKQEVLAFCASYVAGPLRYVISQCVVEFTRGVWWWNDLCAGGSHSGQVGSSGWLLALEELSEIARGTSFTLKYHKFDWSLDLQRKSSVHAVLQMPPPLPFPEPMC